MDLLQTVRKEGSRGGRAEFKWEDVKGSQHRENYLGHSLMAPVGRWQKNKDLSWYAKKDANGNEISEADARKEEIRRVKEAEADAMAKALGYEVPPRASDNPNMTALGGDKEVQQTIKESIEGEEENEEDVGKGIGFGGFSGAQDEEGDDDEVLAGTRAGLMESNGGRAAKEYREPEAGRSRRRDDGDRRKRRRSRSRSRDRKPRREGYNRRDGSGERRHRHAHRSRSRSPRRRRPDSRERRRDHERRHDRKEDYRERDDRPPRNINTGDRANHQDSRDDRRRGNRTDNY